jgi:hypothetical protein
VSITPNAPLANTDAGYLILVEASVVYRRSLNRECSCSALPGAKSRVIRRREYDERAGTRLR